MINLLINNTMLNYWNFSEGYTSISVREPLANIIAQTNEQNAQRRRREIQDSHNNFYATVSDDSGIKFLHSHPITSYYHTGSIFLNLSKIDFYLHWTLVIILFKYKTNINIYFR